MVLFSIEIGKKKGFNSFDRSVWNESNASISDSECDQEQDLVINVGTYGMQADDKEWTSTVVYIRKLKGMLC